jgi:hypothetical protein
VDEVLSDFADDSISSENHSETSNDEWAPAPINPRTDRALEAKQRASGQNCRDLFELKSFLPRDGP